MNRPIEQQRIPTVASLIVRAILVMVAAGLIGKASRLLVDSLGYPEGCSAMREVISSAVGYILAVAVFAWVFFKVFLIPFRTYRFRQRRSR